MAEEKLIGLDLSMTSEGVIKMLLDHPADNAIYIDLLKANRHRPEVLRLLYDHPRTPQEVTAEVASLLSLPVKVGTDLARTVAGEEKEEERLQKARNLLQQVQWLNVGERILLAVRGGKEVRSILIRDPNKEVVMKVLVNPKLTESEVEMIARNPSVPEDALRYIAKKRDWIRKYNVMYALVSNPKTPPGVSMSFVAHLRMQDLVILEKNKNIPEAVRSAAKRYVRMRKK